MTFETYDGIDEYGESLVAYRQHFTNGIVAFRIEYSFVVGAESGRCFGLSVCKEEGIDGIP